MADPRDMSKSDLAVQNNSLESRLARARAKATDATKKIAGTALVVGGGMVAGYAKGAHPDWELGGIDAGLVAGAAFTVVGLAGWAGKASAYIGDAGEGMLAYELGRKVEDKVKDGGSLMSGSSGRPATLADLLEAIKQGKAA